MQTKLNNFVYNVIFIVSILVGKSGLVGAEYAPGYGSLPGLTRKIDSVYREDDLDARFECVELLNSSTVESMTFSEWNDRPAMICDFHYLVKEYTKLMMHIFNERPWLYGRHPKCFINGAGYMPRKEYIFAEICSSNTSLIEFNQPVIPCLAKLIINEHEKAIIVGDIHGEMITIDDIFSSFIKSENCSIMNEQMQISPNVKVIFLGDYMDRGKESFKTLSSVLLLAIKNPGRVVLLRGNHEYINTNVQYFHLLSNIIEEFGIGCECVGVMVDIITDLIMVYEYMIVGMFLGSRGNGNTNFQFLSHAGLDFRYKYSNFLSFEHGSNLCFWNLTKEDITGDIKDFWLSHCSGDSKQEDTINSAFDACHVSFFFSFLDLNVLENSQMINIGPRGLMLSPDIIGTILESNSVGNYKISGIIRGHQHNLPELLSKEPPKSLIYGCAIVVSNVDSAWPHFMSYTINTSKLQMLPQDSKSIITHIGGYITSSKCSYKYKSSYLELMFNSKGWSFCLKS